MKENEKSVSFLVEGEDQNGASNLPDNKKSNKDKLKKPIIFLLMGVVFLGCMYLIFKPSKDKKAVENIGLNDAVPQATGAGMPDDKSKAYEQEMLERKEQEKRNALTTLSDYWNTEDTASADNEESLPEEDEESNGFGGGGRKSGRNGNSALNSYRNAQSTLGSFYQDNNSETMELRKQVDELKAKLSEKDVPPVATVDDQLKLMEKSYEMAAKYLPQNANTGNAAPAIGATPAAAGANQKEQFVSFTPTRKNIVSALYREPSDSAFAADWSQTKNRGFYTAGSTEEVVQPKNSIKACVHEAQTVVGETGVRLRLLEPAKTPQRTIPKGTIVTANAKFQNGRLQLKVTSVELEGNIIPVDITIYDLDGQQGLYVPYSPERNAVTDIVANMGNATGSSFSMSSTPGQQITSDLSKSAVQGISGYFAKKVRTPKVALKAGYQVFLVSKK
ncbi:conjugative transposon protein TraM [Dysgonomonas mossii]|uniref:conjugative transposon protein TraM n=1 Tax=Dysgonomonas mossii TaxID=163665 RepID=UPI001AC5B984|nr:conjugative transposon protein TraM [Dysgonomonas mossii]MBN9302181.1 conjugative transposon protein TraM [Dysgonomonas mossii]